MHRRSLLQLGLGTVGAALAGLLPAGREALRAWAGENAVDPRAEFPLALLRSLLDEVQPGLRLDPLTGLSQHGMREALAQQRLDVATLPSLGLEPRLLPLRWPIRRGLLGLRLLLVREARVTEFAALDSLRALRRRSMSVGADWIENASLRALGFNLKPARGYGDVFDQVRRGEADYASRSAGEIWFELQQPALAGSGLAVVPGIALFYPLDDYLVFAPGLDALVERLDAHMQRFADGDAYWGLFNQHFGEALRLTDLPSRRILGVTGFGVEPGTPVERFDVVQLRPVAGEFRLGAGDASLVPQVR